MLAKSDNRAETRPFLVLKLPRTGSTMFANVLDAHPSVQCWAEYLNRYLEAPRGRKVRALRSFYRDAPSNNPDNASRARGQTMDPNKYGLRTRDIVSAFRPSGLGRISWRLSARRRDLPVRVLVLLRENLLEQGISYFLFRRRGLWPGSRHHVDDPSLLHGQIIDVDDGQIIDVDELARIVRRLGNSAEQIRQLAKELGAPTMYVTYEQLHNDPSTTFDSVFEHLEVPPPRAGFDYTAGFTKVLSEDLSQVMANFAGK